jgi:hypothetical protein
VHRRTVCSVIHEIIENLAAPGEADVVVAQTVNNHARGMIAAKSPKSTTSTTESRKSFAPAWSPRLASQPHLKGQVVDPMLTQVNDRFLAS